MLRDSDLWITDNITIFHSGPVCHVDIVAATPLGHCSKDKVKYTDIAVRSLTCHTATRNSHAI